MSIQAKAHRFWVFTYHDPQDLLDMSDHANVNFLVYQEEVSSETGAYHFQGYVECRNPVGMSGLKKYLGSQTVHLEPRRGTQLEAVAYCTKEDTRVGGPYFYGNMAVGQGHRSDLTEIKSKIDSGSCMKDIASSHFSDYVRYWRGFERYQQLAMEVGEDRNVSVALYYGPTGTGKSYSARLVDKDAHWQSAQMQGWFDGYETQDTLVLDDFYGWIKYHELLRLLDRYPLRLNVKGGQRLARYRRIVITSNRRPDEWYTRIPDISALVRRIHRIIHFWDPDLVGCPRSYGNFADFKAAVDPTVNFD